KTDFMRMTLDGKTTQKLYTTENDSSISPYGFFAKGGYVYVVVLDGSNLISVKTDRATGKVVDTLLIAEDVTSAVIPTKPVYYDGITENSIYDFIYFSRNATADDITQTGEILEFIRPDGSSRQIFEADGVSDYTLEYLRDGYLFYRKPKNGATQLFASNLHTALASADTAYANDEYNANLFNEEKSVLNDSDIANLGVYAFVNGYEFGTSARSNSVNVLSFTKPSSDSSNETEIVVKRYVDGVCDNDFSLSAVGLSIETHYDNQVYYSADGTLYSISIASGSAHEIVQIAENYVAGTYGAEVAGEHLIYFGGNGDATQYAFFKDLNGLEGKEDMFVGQYLDSEVPSTVESIVVETTPTKTNYKLGESLDLTGIVVKATLYRDSNGQRPEPVEITVTKDMISGFDPNTSGDQSVTITYEKRTTTFDVNVSETRATQSCATVAPTTPWFFIGGGLILVLGAGALILGKRKKA
ncbi:MAG: bacterial Ig-like domain-containing protein, partial [Clostridia bacterium]|nr:bacterial Ig-like domain-containing protein [Clostridia bacterium]